MGFNEPIAIIGMSCRFPGAPNLRELWHLLETGGNAIAEMDAGSDTGRFRELFSGETPRSRACHFGGFVEGIDRFDASFFRISPVEAQLLDPQQRMMLETCWQALEDAGINPDRLRGSSTGVYTGISTDEYRTMVLESARPVEAAGCLYALSGTNMNGAAGRVAFVLGLTGPVKAVDAACASSLVSVHDAVTDLQQGRADLALAGGVYAMLSGRIYELRADSMMLSPDGQCKAFDASANGYVRGEGCGVVVLKRLGEAIADGDRIWAQIRGSAVNHGGAGVGLTVPNTPALEQVIKTALAQADLVSSEIDYLEAHGTGTTVGDPIEINAAAAAYSENRHPDNPLLVGSVKTNIGHLESAAGVAGVIKAAMAIKSGIIPKHLHFQNPNPSIDWDNMPLKIVTEKMRWPHRQGIPRRAGVNSFGISGTNAHMILEEYRPSSKKTIPRPKRRPSRLLALSGKTDGALRGLAKSYLSWLDQETLGESLLADMAWTSAVGRSHFHCRRGIVFRDLKSLREGLEKVAETGPGKRQGSPGKVAFVYTGQGSQWVGMGRELYRSWPVAKEVFDRCETVFRKARGVSLLDVMFGRSDNGEKLGDTAWEQPALYALECALTALWSSVGIDPDIVVGHSVGEIAAAYTAGNFSLEDGMHFAQARGTLLSSTKEGGMAAVFAPSETVTNGVREFNEKITGPGLSVAADNGLHQVISGSIVGVETISKHFESEGIRVRRLNTTRAFHSALLEPVLDKLEASLEDVEIHDPKLTFISNLTGRSVGSKTELDGKYWRRHAREPVAFARSVQEMADIEVDLVMEIGPGRVLTPMVLAAWPESSQAPRALSSLSPPAQGAGEFPEAVAKAYEAGLPVSFEGLFTEEKRRRISVPGYVFQRERYWLEKSKRRQKAGHPLLGVRHESAEGKISYEVELSSSVLPWLKDHRVFGRLIAPGALYGAMAASAALAESGRVSLTDMQLHNPLVFADEDSEDESLTVQVLVSAAEPAGRPIKVFSKNNNGEWTLHMEGKISPRIPPGTAEKVDLESLKSSMSPMDAATYYRARAGTGVELGPSFQTLKGILVAPGEALAEISLPETLQRSGTDMHPLVLDGCFQVLGAARGLGGVQGSTTYLPFCWDQLWLAGPLSEHLLCHVRMRENTQDTPPGIPPEIQSGDISLYDSDGVLIGKLSGHTVKRATMEALLSATTEVDELLYEVIWREQALPPGLIPADFFPAPETVKKKSKLFCRQLSSAGVEPNDRADLLADLERWSRSYALANLDRLGWRRERGKTIKFEDLRRQLKVSEEHRRFVASDAGNACQIWSA